MALLTKTGKETSTSTTAPWISQQPYLEKGFSEADDLYGAPGPAYFPDSTVTGFSPEQIESQNSIMQTARAGSPTMDAANQYATDLLTGEGAIDPYGDSVFANIQSKVMPAIDSKAMMSGRLGSGAHVDTLGRALTEAYSPWASQNWQFGQGQRMDAMKFAPDLRKMDYFDAGAMGLVGQEKQDQAQLERDDAKARWDYYQALPQKKLSDYMGMIGGQSWGSQNTSTVPVTKPTQFGEILGGVTGLLGGLGDIFGGSIF